MTSPAGDTRQQDWMRSSPVAGLTALIVGAGSGMGAACARTFAANGGSVVVADLDEASAVAVASEIAGRGERALAVQIDVADQQDIERAVRATIDEFGRLDVLINVATMVKGTMLEQATQSDWDRAFRVNVWGALALAQACLPHLRQSPSPAIVHAGSLAGMHGYAGSGSYGPSKAALITLSRQMALEWAVEGIRVNVVVPGTIQTPALERDLSPVAIETRKRQVPLGRLSHPSEQADVAVFLASPAASFVTAQVFVCDGGFSQSLYPQPMGMGESLRERAERLSAEGSA
jgi:NAD(P)-dependent dehydrogenase (short-subunit alcohol dehydrogenase family)